MPTAPAERIECSADHATHTTMAAWQRAYAAQPVVPVAAAFKYIAPVNSISRAGGDAHAAWQRWHNVLLDTQLATLFTAAQWPWYAVLERARVETLASRDLPGMARNLAPNPVQLQHLQPAYAPWAPIYAVARTALASSEPAPCNYSQAELTPAPAASWWPRWLKRNPVPAAPTAAYIANTLQQAQAMLGDGLRFAHTVRPLVQLLAAYHARTNGVDAPLPGNPRQHAPDLPQQPDPELGTEIAAPEGAASTTPANLSAESAYPGYQVFTHQWDEEAFATQWLTPQDNDALHQLQALDHTKVRQLAHRLQRRLLAARLRHWAFDQDEGRLDSRRLSRLLTQTAQPRVFRVEAEAPLPEACVTLLIDQSGSMRGARQRMAVQAIDLAVHTLQTCHISCEVLGYTTRFGADNPLLQAWHQAGQPAQPGRLNALRHIVYKTSAQPWRRARSELGLLLRDGFGRENIDGEALHWAACRLMRQAQPRKILIVLSDGAPYDPATAQANGRPYLENHLREVIAQIERSPIQLVALGAGQDVGRYYRHALTLQQPEAVAELLFNRLAELLTHPDSF